MEQYVQALDNASGVSRGMITMIETGKKMDP